MSNLAKILSKWHFCLARCLTSTDQQEISQELFLLINSLTFTDRMNFSDLTTEMEAAFTAITPRSTYERILTALLKTNKNLAMLATHYECWNDHAYEIISSDEDESSM